MVEWTILVVDYLKLIPLPHPFLLPCLRFQAAKRWPWAPWGQVPPHQEGILTERSQSWLSHSPDQVAGTSMRSSFSQWGVRETLLKSLEKILVSDIRNEPADEKSPLSSLYSLPDLTMVMEQSDVWSCSSHLVSIRQKSKEGKPISWDDTTKS